MRKIIQWKLKFLAKMIIRKYKPKIIGITGSVGKTSAREAIYCVLSTKFRTNRPTKNYNNEIGLPLTIIGEESPGKSLLGWVKVLSKAAALAFSRNKDYPEVLILEFGIDRPGDMDYLLKVAKPDIGVITMIAYSHAEFFGSIDEILEEKMKLVKGLKSDGIAILNFDDDTTKSIRSQIKNTTVSYGFKVQADMKATNLKFNFENEKEVENLYGMGYELVYEKERVVMSLPDVIGYQAIYASLAAASVALSLGISLEDTSKALRKLRLPAGRMKLIDGIKNTLIVDDTYNSSSPQSSFLAIDLIKQLNVDESARKYVVLGDMLELGAYTEEAHQDVGKYVFNSGIHKLIAVGERARDIARGAEIAGMKRDDIFLFPNSEEAGKFLQNRIREGDLILAKGSQGMRMEKVVKEIMAEPLRAKELLVRQEDNWQDA